MMITSLPAVFADDGAEHDLGVGDALLGAQRHRQAEPAREGGRLLGVAHVRGDDDGVGEVSAAAEVLGELMLGMQVVARDAEEAVHLRGVQRHRQHAAGAGGGQEIGDQPPADRDARRVLLVGAGVGVERDHHA